MSELAPAGFIGVKAILVATDFSEASDKPLRHALTVARHFGAKLYLAHVTFMKVDDYAERTGRRTAAVASVEAKVGKAIKK